MRNLIQKILGVLAKKIVQKHKPKIIAITGSFGKTSTRLAISLVLEQQYHVRASEKNYNNELGVPFTIIGASAAGSNIFAWLFVMLKGLMVWLLPLRYPEMLVLEMGVDHPGDMDVLVGIAPPLVGVITTIGDAHYQHFESLEAIETEKGKLAEALPETGILVLNSEDAGSMRQAKKTHASVLSYGFQNSSYIRILRTEEKLAETLVTEITFLWEQEAFSVHVPAVGRPHVLACAAAVAVGIACGVKPEAIKAGLEYYHPFPGRLNPLPGIKDSVLLDDSYNASPKPVMAALDLLAHLPGRKRIAILGDMLELGTLTEEKHREIGKYVSGLGLDFLITLGSAAQVIAESARGYGMDAHKVHAFHEMYSLINFVEKEVEPGTIVLVKGSQGMRMEKISRELLADKNSAPEVLPRQYGSWTA